MKYQFTKMHGIGNDYIYFNCFNQKISNPKELSIKVSNRNYGIGSDGIILIMPSKLADAKMMMYNADGSIAQMCGNGIRCMGKYLIDNNLVRHDDFITIETLSGIKVIKYKKVGNKVKYLTVNMGDPVIKSSEIPVIFSKEEVIDEELIIDNISYKITCISMGNPHCVVFVPDIDKIDIKSIGPKFENHKMFPERINTEFAQIINNKTIKMKVWERGSGETLACGTGACAVVVAAILNGYCKSMEDIKVILPGGNLMIKYNDINVFMSGEAVDVFTGEVEI